MKRIKERGLEKHLNEIVALEQRDIRYIRLHGILRFGDPAIGILGSDYFDRNGNEVYYIEAPIDMWHWIKEGISRLKGNEKIHRHNKWQISLKNSDLIIIFYDAWEQNLASRPNLSKYQVCLSN